MTPLTDETQDLRIFSEILSIPVAGLLGQIWNLSGVKEESGRHIFSLARGMRPSWGVCAPLLPENNALISPNP